MTPTTPFRLVKIIIDLAWEKRSLSYGTNYANDVDIDWEYDCDVPDANMDCEYADDDPDASNGFGIQSGC
jgi:hypothetical protein